MTLKLLKETFTVCQIADGKEADLTRPFTFFARTDEELSLVCPADACPKGTLKKEEGWRCLKVMGPLDFSLIGILAKIADTLAKAGVSIFAVSTYDTDYVLLRAERLADALQALTAAGYVILE